ncbi:Uncharacterised protein [Citrobacter braakii]|uniref:hypothetical protein n=1 Tax=Citrobacter braakii TaxID=57706 RepID=UPI000E031453|nr:hypothetical protein [Citrobacter braakii]STJ26717.1 Uncharacterised protein [Citrobacter braakii]
MKQENYPAYTVLTNSALSNALALECMIEAYIDEQETDLLEPAFCLSSEQIATIRKIRDISESNQIPELIKLSARSIGVSLMISALSDAIDNGEETESSKELPEAILTMIKDCILGIKTIRCNLTDK